MKKLVWVRFSGTRYAVKALSLQAKEVNEGRFSANKKVHVVQ